MLLALVMLSQRYKAKYSISLDFWIKKKLRTGVLLLLSLLSPQVAAEPSSVPVELQDFRQTLSVQGVQPSSCLKSPLGL